MQQDPVQKTSRAWTSLTSSDGTTATGTACLPTYHTDDVVVDWKGQAPTSGIDEHIRRHEGVRRVGRRNAASDHIAPISFGSGDWTCVVGEFVGVGRMVTVAKWRDDAIVEEYIWSQRRSAARLAAQLPGLKLAGT